MSENSTSLVVDLDSLDETLVQEEVFIDPNADPFASPPPPPDGTHRFKLKIQKDSWKSGKTKKGTPQDYLSCKVQANVVAEGEKWNNLTAFDGFVSTLVYDGKSRMAGILKAVGSPIEGNINRVALAKAFRAALAGEPICRIRGRWNASENVAKPGEDKVYKSFLTGIRNFPQKERTNPETGEKEPIPGEYDHVVRGPVSGEDVAAQFEILEYLPD
jgi:hypothetical protein